MPNYSIKDLEQLSGIKAHTLRIWEKRHGLLSPKRTDTNIRYYDDYELKKLLNISILNEQGIKISKIASMSHIELEGLVKDISSNSRSYKFYIDQLIIAMVDLDEPKFEGVLHEVAMKIGFEDLVTNVLYNFLEQIGVLWLTGNINPAQEHFISNLIRQKIIVAIDQLPYHPNKDLPSIMLFLPEKEMHEIGLLFYYYLAKKIGFKVFYLGQYVPSNDVFAAMDRLEPTYLLCSLTTAQHKDGGVDFFNECASRNFCQKIFLSGPGVDRKKIKGPKFSYFDNSLELKDVLLNEAKNV